MKFRSTLKLALVAGFTTFTALNATAQKAYVKLGGGYNFGIGSGIGYQADEHNSYSGFSASTGYSKYERVNINHGKGGVFGGAFGYMFNNNIGFEIGVNYLAGSKNELENKKSTSGSDIPTPVTTETYTTKSQMILVQPSLVMAAGLPKFNPYTRIGLVAAKGKIKNTYSYSDSNGGSMGSADELSGGWGFGLQAALGFDFKLNDNVSIYTEGTFNNLTYSPEKGEVTKYNRNETDLLHTLSTSQKEIRFEDELTVNHNSNPSASKPSTGYKERITLNSVGLNVGVKFNF